MADQPFTALPVAKQLGTSHKKQPPALQPDSALPVAINFIKNSSNGLAVFIRIVQPGFSSFLIMPAIYQPLFFNTQHILKMQQGIG